MSGHSKWHNIKLRKSKVDAVKGQAFTRVAREIIMAARQGGGNPETNFRLKMAVAKAKEVNMPGENIRRAIQRGSGELDGASYDEVVYEGYGPGGVAILVEAATDNRNRTVADLRNLFAKNGGNLGESGCVGWMFEKKGLIQIVADNVDEDAVLSCVLEAGALDMRRSEDTLEVTTSPEELETVKEALEKENFPYTSAEVSMMPQNVVSVSQEDASRLLKLLEVVEDHDDVQKVWANFDIPDEVLERIS